MIACKYFRQSGFIFAECDFQKFGWTAPFLEIWPSLQKKVFLTPKKVKIGAPKKRLSPNPCWQGRYAKNRVQNGQIWPLQLHFWSTDAYRGFPPHAIFPLQVNKEIYHGVSPPSQQRNIAWCRASTEFAAFHGKIWLESAPTFLWWWLQLRSWFLSVWILVDTLEACIYFSVIVYSIVYMRAWELLYWKIIINFDSGDANLSLTKYTNNCVDSVNNAFEIYLPSFLFRSSL